MSPPPNNPVPNEIQIKLRRRSSPRRPHPLRRCPCWPQHRQVGSPLGPGSAAAVPVCACPQPTAAPLAHTYLAPAALPLTTRTTWRSPGRDHPDLREGNRMNGERWERHFSERDLLVALRCVQICQLIVALRFVQSRSILWPLKRTLVFYNVRKIYWWFRSHILVRFHLFTSIRYGWMTVIKNANHYKTCNN
jgi:hypothetical protein